jgi:hypothetical protein
MIVSKNMRDLVSQNDPYNSFISGKILGIANPHGFKNNDEIHDGDEFSIIKWGHIKIWYTDCRKWIFDAMPLFSDGTNEQHKRGAFVIIEREMTFREVNSMLANLGAKRIQDMIDSLKPLNES